MAAELMIARLENLFGPHLVAAVAATVGGQKGASVPPITPLRRDGSLAMLAPFPADHQLAVLSMEVDDGGVLPWLVTFAMPLFTLARLFGFADASAEPRAPGTRPATQPAISASQAPFADLPLPVSAVIVDMSLPFSAIACLAPGQILPVAVARNVPLKVGDAIFAHGTVGSVDDRVAIQISTAF